MARRAKFGRQPRIQPNISATLLAIAREQVARQDSNIMDAWKNGGLYKGAPVTDEKVLAYWNDRKKNLDKRDPLYDQVNDEIMQLQYGVEQSKADLLHVQGKMSDSQYANFFIRWAAKAPRNSEWWRTLQKDAAQLIERAKATAKANSDKRKQDAFNSFVLDKNKDIAVGTALTDAITQMSKESGLSVVENGDQLLAMLSEDFKRSPDKYRALADALRTSGANFDGTFTHAFVAANLDTASQAYGLIATRANAAGYASAYATAAKGQSDLTSWATNLKVWPVAKAYDRAYEAFSKVWGDPNASYKDKAAAASAFSQATALLAKDPGIDTASKSMLIADSQRAIGQDAGDSPSFGAAVIGHAGVTPEMQQTVAMTTAAQMAMDQNPGAFVYAPVDKNGNFDPTGQGSVGIVPTAAVPSNAVFVARPGILGSAQMVAVQPHSIMVGDPNDPSAAPTTIGSFISYNIGGVKITQYGYQDANGVAKWSLTSPLADGTSTAPDKDGNLLVTLPGIGDPNAKAAAIDQKYGTNIAASMVPGAESSSVVYQRDSNGKVTNKVTVKYDGKGFSVTSTQQVLDPDGHITDGSTVTLPLGVNSPQDLQKAATAPSRWTGGDVPGVTFDSPAAASIAATQTSMSGAQVASLAQDPTFQHAFLQQTMQTLGTTNPLDPRVVAAWKQATAAASSPSSAESWRLPDNSVVTAQAKDGLTYPGGKAQDPTKTNLSINFGGQSLTLPDVPAYLKGPNGQAPSLDLSGLTSLLGGGATPFSQSVLQPGQVPGITTPGAPPPATITATPTPAPKPVAPTTTGVLPSTGQPADVPKSTVAPVPNPSGPVEHHR